MVKHINNKYVKMDDGFQPELIRDASLSDLLEFPTIEKNKEIRIPDYLIPYSKLQYYDDASSNFCCFYEMDTNFTEVISNPTDKNILKKLSACAGIVTPDCSVYINAPLCVQILSIYRGRAIGAYFQSRNVYTVANVRWGDERTYTAKILPEPIAFLGIPKKSIVSIGSYGAIKNPETRKHFRKGLIAMLDFLHPQITLVYGAMPNKIFEDLKTRTKFIQFDNWTKLRHGRMS